MASKVKVEEVPVGGPKPAKAAPPPDIKNDFPATPAQSAQKAQQEKLGDTPLPAEEEAAKIGGKPGELKELNGKPITTQDAAHIAAAEAAVGKPTGPGSLAAKAQSAAAANERDGIQGASQQAQTPSAPKKEAASTPKKEAPKKEAASAPKKETPSAPKKEAPEALSDNPGETQSEKKRGVSEPKVHYYKESEIKGENEKEEPRTYASALRRPKHEVEVEREDEAAQDSTLRKWLVPGAVTILVVGVGIVVIAAIAKNRQPSTSR